MRTAAALGAALGGALALSACADRLPVDDAGRHTALPPSPVFTVPHSAPASTPAPAPAPSSEAPPAARDTCGAADLAYLVGKPRTEIPIPADLTRRRVVCTTCPLTPEVRPERQTITYDGATNLVAAVSCG